MPSALLSLSWLISEIQLIHFVVDNKSQVAAPQFAIIRGELLD